MYFIPSGIEFEPFFESIGFETLLKKITQIVCKKCTQPDLKTYTRNTPKIRSYFEPKMLQKIQARNLTP
jgi:hypothetical protein